MFSFLFLEIIVVLKGKDKKPISRTEIGFLYFYFTNPPPLFTFSVSIVVFSLSNFKFPKL